MKKKVKYVIPMIILVVIIVVIVHKRENNKNKYDFSTDKITISKRSETGLVKVKDIMDKDEIEKVINMLNKENLSKEVVTPNDSAYTICVKFNDNTVISLKPECSQGIISNDFAPAGLTVYMPTDFCDYIYSIVKV